MCPLVSAEGFKDSGPTSLDLHRVPLDDMVTEQYDYDSDSDLEDEGGGLDRKSNEPAPKDAENDELAEYLVYVCLNVYYDLSTFMTFI